MPRTPIFPSLWWLATPLLVLACSHDSPRDNPLDPTLTPPVELQVTLDDTAGTATLTWTRYEGEAEFGAYWVLRSEVESTRVDTLETVPDVGQTTHVDTSLTPDTAHVYRVSTVNTAGFEVASEPRTARGVHLPPVQIVRTDFRSQTASCSLTWTPYRGPRFAAYQLRRRTEDQASRVIIELPDSSTTSWIDSGLKGATEYHYQVVVQTQRGEQVASPEAAGGIHRLVATWPLEVEISGRTTASRARLYAEPGGGIAALMCGVQSVAIATYGAGDGLIEKRDLGFAPAGGQILATAYFLPNNVAMSTDPSGRRAFSCQPRVYGHADAGGAFGVLHLQADGSPIHQDWQPFAESLPWALDDIESTVLGGIRLVSLHAETGVAVSFDNAEVFVAGQSVFREDFESFPDEEPYSEVGAVEGWQYEGSHYSRDGWTILGPHGGAIGRADTAWQDFRLEADVIAREQRFFIEVGGQTYSRFRLIVDGIPATDDPQHVELVWSFNPPEGLDVPARADTVSEPFRVLYGMRYRLALEAVDGVVGATVRGPVASIGYLNQESVYGSLGTIGETLALTFDDRAYSVNTAGEISEPAVLEGNVSESRVWHVPGERFPRMGVCMPEENRIRTGMIIHAATWSEYLKAELGAFIDKEAGSLSYPVSFDVGPDGRMYVLDAGNSRVVSFDGESGYISEWGGAGSGDGEFNFGYGLKGRGEGLDFAGSVAVDDEGYIYVADIHNQRLQVFAP